MKRTKFAPWVGRDYRKGFSGFKWLILGESQYGDSGRKTWSTQRIVQELAIENRRAFFTKIAKLVLHIPAGRCLSDEKREWFWHRVAFYNFIQSVLPAPRHRPTEENWEIARPLLMKVLHEHQPHIILILGKELEYRLRHSSEIPGNIVRVSIAHPSSKGFSYKEWSSKVREGMDNARNRNAHLLN